MARVGLRNFRYSILDENEKVKAPKTLGKAVDCKVSLSLNDAKLHADDVIVESDNKFSEGTITLTVDDDNDEIFAELLGHQITTEKETNRNVDDVAPYVSLGRIIVKQVNGKMFYKVEFLHKVKFKDFMPDEETKKSSTEYKTVTIEGIITALKSGDWSKSKTFTDYQEASTYLDKLLTVTG